MKPPSSGPHSDIDGLHRSAIEGDENKHPDGGTADQKRQEDHESKAKPAQSEQKPGGDGGKDEGSAPKEGNDDHLMKDQKPITK